MTQPASASTQSTRNYVQISPPENFDFGKPEAWPLWKKRIERYFTISGLNRVEESEKVDTLLYIMGSRSEEVFLQLPDDKKGTFSLVLEEFDKYFKPQKNVIFDRFCFNSRKQMPGESVDSFITDLYSMVEKCDFGELKEDLLRDRIVVGMADSKTSEILQLKADLTLSEAAKIARLSEMQHKYNKVLREKENEYENETKEINFAMKTNQRGRNFERKEREVKNEEACCYFCGESRHPRKFCPAREVTCFNCKVKGHLRKVCRKEIKNVRAIDQHFDDGFDGDVKFIGNINKSFSEPWLVPISIEEAGQTFNFMLDTGADCICFPIKYIKKFCPNLLDKIKPTRDILVGPDRSPLKNVNGILDLTLNYKYTSKKFNVYLLKNLKYPILSREAIGLLGLMKSLYINSLSSTVVIDKEFPRLLREIGEFKGCVNVKLKEGSVPFAQSVPRPVPIPLYDKLEKEIKRLVELDIIEPVSEATEWVAPIVVVPKQNGEVRLCVDYTQLNKHIKRPYFPILGVDMKFGRIQNASIFSRIDLNKGFHQIKLAAECQHLTTFIWPFGRFLYKRLPFGLSCSPEYFVEKFSRILTGIPNVIFHVDEVLIFANDQQIHNEVLREVLKRIDDEGVTINMEKSEIGVCEIKFLGQILNKNGISVDPERIRAITSMKAPTNKTELLRFLGMVNFIANFIQNRTDVLAPLNSLLEKNTVYVWDVAQQQSFKKIIKVISTAPVLKYFNQSRKTIIAADASAVGLGACLFQLNDQNEREIISFASRTLQLHERHYAPIEMEAMALVWALEKFQGFVIGIPVTLQTDHKPLLQVLQTKNLDTLTPRLLRLRIRLMRFEYRIEYIPGKEQTVADCLSRAPVTFLNEDISLSKDIERQVNLLVKRSPITDPYLLKIKEKQNNDFTCIELKKYVLSGWPEKRLLTPNLQSYYQHRSDFAIIDDLLVKEPRIVVTKALQSEVINFIHQVHQGVVKCRRRAQSSVWWLGVNSEIDLVIKNCPKCIEHRTNPREDHTFEDFPTRPWEKLGADLFKEGSWYLIVVDYYSRYFEIFKLQKSQTEDEVIHCFEELFSRFGKLDEVRSDNGPQFRSRFKSFLNKLGISHNPSSPKFSQSNGEAEAAVKIAKSLITKNSENLWQALLEYRSTPLKNGLSPAELLFGRKIRSCLPMLTTKYK